VALALAVATKIWYVVPAALIWLLLWDRRRMLALAGGFAAGLAAVVLPFLAAAPGPFVQQVLLDQLDRPESSWSVLRRLADMFALRPAANPPAHVAQLIDLKLTGLLVAAVVLAVLALATAGARRYVLLSAVAVVVLLLSPSYFSHYAAFLAPALAVVVGIGVERLVRIVRHPPLQVTVVTLALLGFALLNRHADLARTSEPIPADDLRPAAAQVAGCITSDDPLTLAELNVLSRDFRRGCEVWVDVTGHTYDRDKLMLAPGRAVPRPLNPKWQRDVKAYLLSGDALIIHRNGTGLADATVRALTGGGELARSGRHDGHWVLHLTPRT
jgi:hypothetical protein